MILFLLFLCVYADFINDLKSVNYFCQCDVKPILLRVNFSTKNGPIDNSQFHDLSIGKRLIGLCGAILGAYVNFTFNVQFHKQLLTNSQYSKH